MIVNSISNMPRKIIDAHGHTGVLNSVPCNWKPFLDSNLPNGDVVEKVVVSNINGILKNSKMSDYIANIEMLEQCKEYPSKFAPLAVCRPEQGNVSEIERLFREYPNKFYGLKFHPNESVLRANSEQYTPYLKFAEKHNLPSVFHCQKNGLSDASAIYEAAQRVPKTPVVLAHLSAGPIEDQIEAINIIEDSIRTGKANLYTDISWVNIDEPNGTPTIIELIKRLKNIDGKDYTDRIMFGSDAPIARFASQASGVNSYSGYIDKIKKSIIADDELKANTDELIEKIFYKNAYTLFLDRTAEIPPVAGKSKYAKIAIAGLIALAGIGTYFYAKNKDVQPSANVQRLNVRNNFANYPQFDQFVRKS